MTPSYLYSVYIIILAYLAIVAHAAPLSAALSRRQDSNASSGSPRTITTHRVIPVTGGSIVEDCTVTFTDIVVDGKNLVRKESRCSELFVPNGQPLPAPSPPITTVTQEPPATTTTDTTTTTTTTTTTDAPPQTTEPPPPPPDVSTTSSDPAATTPPADTTSATDGGTTTEVPPPPSDTNTLPPPESSSTPVGTPPASPSSSDQGGASDTGVIVLGPTSVPAESAGSGVQGQTAATGTRENSETSQSAASVNIPGKEIEVLPIGLGVFAGISVIALIVVGLVTYERTKYRKAFRQRRLAASGTEMGYGGMSERR